MRVGYLLASSMNRTVILLAGLLAFSAWAALWCVPRHVAHIEADLATRSREALAEAGIAADVTIDGQIVTLSGGALDAGAAATAGQIVAALPGVSRVVNALTVEPAAATAAAAAYRFEAVSGADSVTLSGYVQDDTQRASVVGLARRVFAPRRVIDRLALRAAGGEDQEPALKLGIEQLAHLETGRFTIAEGRATLSGVAPDPTVRDRVQSVFDASRLEPLRAATSLRLPPPTPARRDDCQAQFDRVLRNQNVRFATGSATISADSFPLLDALAAAVRACADVAVEVQGHTDARGDAEANLALSRRRAEAVVDYLVGDGVDGDQLRARGYGETQPRQSNDTRAGRAANRRIELRALMPNGETTP